MIGGVRTQSSESSTTTSSRCVSFRIVGPVIALACLIGLPQGVLGASAYFPGAGTCVQSALANIQDLFRVASKDFSIGDSAVFQGEFKAYLQLRVVVLQPYWR